MGDKTNDYDAVEKVWLNRSMLARWSTESNPTELLRQGCFLTYIHCGSHSVDAVVAERIVWCDFGRWLYFTRVLQRTIFGIYEMIVTDICNAMICIEIVSDCADLTSTGNAYLYFFELLRNSPSFISLTEAHNVPTRLKRYVNKINRVFYFVLPSISRHATYSHPQWVRDNYELSHN